MSGLRVTAGPPAGRRAGDNGPVTAPSGPPASPRDAPATPGAYGPLPAAPPGPPSAPPGTHGPLPAEAALPGAVAPSPLVEVDEPRAARRGVRLLLKRDDLVHPELVGNKYRKLLLNLAEARRAGHDTLLTFGGAYSNHLRATARAGRLHGFRTVGVVRGQELADRPLNPSLAAAAADGMRLHFVERAAYRRLTDRTADHGRAPRDAREGQGAREAREGQTARDAEEAREAREAEEAREAHEARAASGELAALLAAYGPAYVLPEGGSNAAAVRGCAGLGRELAGRADVAVVACGTGGTLAGLAAGFPGEAVGVAVLRGGFLGEEVLRLQHAAYGGRRGRWRVEDGFHHGGYARTTPALDALAAGFARRHGLRPEPVYVAKALYAALELTDAGAFARGSRVAVVITG